MCGSVIAVNPSGLWRNVYSKCIRFIWGGVANSPYCPYILIINRNAAVSFVRGPEDDCLSIFNTFATLKKVLSIGSGPNER